MRILRQRVQQKTYSLGSGSKITVYRQKEFGLASKLLFLISPGAWQGKEAAKYAYTDPKEYKRKRWKHALKGLFTPGTASAINSKARKMAETGSSPDEIRKYIENPKASHLVSGGAEVATGGYFGLGNLYAGAKGIGDALSKRRSNMN